MSSFTEPLTLTYLPKRNMWITEREFAYFVGEEDSKEKIIVPKGFTTDLASVPWPASMLIPKSGKFNQSAVLHDFLYSKLGILDDKTYTRAECDGIFLEAMGVLGVPWFKRRIMHRAVRLGGGIGWRIHAYRKEKADAKS